MLKIRLNGSFSETENGLSACVDRETSLPAWRFWPRDIPKALLGLIYHQPWI